MHNNILCTIFVHLVFQLPDLKTSQAFQFYPYIGEALLGSEVFSEDGNIMSHPANKFVENIMVHAWQRFRHGLDREQKSLQVLKDEVERLWKGIETLHYPCLRCLSTLFHRFG